MVTPGVQAVCLCFPYKEAIKEKYHEEDSKFKEVGQEPVDPTILWMKQTVRPVDLIDSCVCLFCLLSFCLFCTSKEKGGAVLHGGLCIDHVTNQISNACGTMALIHALANVCLYS